MAKIPLAKVVLLCAALTLGACTSSVFYHPDRILYSTPENAGLKFEQMVFTAADGTRLVGWFIPAADRADPREAEGTVIHFHGNAQNISAHWQFVDWLPRRGYNVFTFDYRGYGGSEGQPSPAGLFLDSQGALDYVRHRHDVNPERLLVFAQSLGGANAIAAVGAGNRAGIRAMAVEATFASYSAIASDKMAGTGMLMDDSYSAERYVDKLSPIPLLLIHGTADPVIPDAHSKALLEKAKPPKELILVPGGGHIEATTERYGEKYRDALLAFFRKAFAP